MEQWKRVVIPIVLLFFSLLTDGLIVALFTEQLNVPFGFMSPRLFVLVVIMLAFYLEPRHMIILTVVFGFIYDSYFSGLLGIYIAGLTLIAYFVMQLRKIFDTTYLIILLVSIIMITFLEFFVFGIYTVLDLTTMGVQNFMAGRLSASLLFNTVIAVFLILPLKYVIQSMGIDRKDNKDKSKSSISYR
ncbi:rod shape-determining protein MreD [Alkalibacterium sp. s-m-22]|uniref:Rod shape-determining protein MreD n=1 Tax=Alkalibacterium indicireducens TaxID=398758 RepID=A0ABP3KU67_9LACT